MKKILFLILCSVLFFNIPLAFTQTTRTWQQTSVTDFSQGLFDHTTILNKFGGELQLNPPLSKTKNDTLDNTHETHRIYNQSRQYIKYWYHDEINNYIFYIQRFQSTNQPIDTVGIKVNDSDKRPNWETLAAGYMSNGFSLTAFTTLDSNLYVQLLDSLGNKIGGNQLLTDTAYAADILANEEDSTFSIFIPKAFDNGDGIVDSVVVFSFKMDLTGTIIQSHQRVRRVSIFTIFCRIKVSTAHNGDFVMIFLGSDPSAGLGEYLFFQRFKKNGAPLGAVHIIGDVNQLNYRDPQIAFDDSDRFLIVWSDTRTTLTAIEEWNIYGQLFDTNNVKVGKTFLVNIPKPGFLDHSNIQVFFRNNQYLIAWKAEKYLYPNVGNYFYQNEWKYSFAQEGSFSSTINYAGPLIDRYSSLNFTSNLPSHTFLKFQLRSAQSESELLNAPWVGPGRSSDSFYTNSGQSIDSLHDEQAYLQYKVYFSTDEWGSSPELRDISISYKLREAPPPLPPPTIFAQAGHSVVRITWQPSPSTHIRDYKIYRSTTSTYYDENWTKSVPETTFVFIDSNVINKPRYYYAITAVDSNLLESDFSYEASATPYPINIYVSEETMGGESGTLDHPFRTIRQGMNFAVDHDTVIVLPGTYQERVIIKPLVTLRGSGPRSTIISLTGDSSVVNCGDRSSVSGFTIKQGGSGGGIWGGPATCSIYNNVILNNNRFSLNSAGIEGTFGNKKIFKNYVAGFDGGIMIWENGSNTTVTNNLIIARVGGIGLFNNARATIINNTIIIQDYHTGIAAFSYPVVTVKNNIIIGYSTNGGQGFSTPGNIQYQRLSITYNDVWRFQNNYPDVVAGAGCISTDPLFINMQGTDFHLQVGSPCKDAGDPGNSYNDKDGTRNDMGAFGGPDPLDATIIPGLAVTLSSESSSGFPGDTVDVRITIDNAARLASAQFSLGYNPSIVMPISINTTNLTSTFQLSVDTAAGGVIAVSLTNSSNIGSGAGEILNVRFRISSTATAQDASPLSLNNVQLQDNTGRPLIISELSNGVIAVSAGYNGGRYVFVDRDNKSGTEDGSRYHPWHSIQLGINHATTGDTVLVASGLYSEAVEMRDSIYLRGSGANVTTVQGDSASAFQLKPTITFQNINGTGISKLTVLQPPIPLLSAVVSNSSNIEIFDCFFSGTASYTSSLIYANNNSKISIFNNHFSGNSAISIANSEMSIFRNIIKNENGNNAIQIYNTNGVINNNRIYISEGDAIGIHSIYPIQIFNNLIRSIGISGRGITTLDSDSIIIVNNTIDTRSSGIITRNSIVNIMNNIITGNIFYGLNLSVSSISSYNDVWGNGTNFYNTSPGPNDLSIEPAFENVGKENYHLSQGSFCINRGNPDKQFNDLDNSRNDIGLYGGQLLDTIFFNHHGAELKIIGSSVSANETLNVQIDGMFLRGTASAELRISYNPLHLAFIKATTTAKTSLFSISEIMPEPGLLFLKLKNNVGLSVDSAEIATLQFIPQQANVQTALTFKQARLFFETSAEIPIAKLSDKQILITSIPQNETVPLHFSIQQNYPNPFNPSTTIRYSVPNLSNVNIKIYNVLGQEVKTLISRVETAGDYVIMWDATNNAGNQVSSGIYFCSFSANDFRNIIKMVLIR